MELGKPAKEFFGMQDLSGDGTFGDLLGYVVVAGKANWNLVLE